MRPLFACLLAAFALFVGGCTWSSAQPLAAADGGDLPVVEEDASNDATPVPADDANIPFVVDGASINAGSAALLAAGGQETCAVTSAGAVWCWGSNVDDQLGTSTGPLVTLPGSTEAITGSFVPVQVTSAGTTATSVAVGDFHACALSRSAGAGGAGAASAQVACWGANSYGQLGGGTGAMTQTPVAVAGLGDVTAIAAGGYHTCALAAGEVKCWGDNAQGQLGDGTTTNSTAPVAVTGLSGITAIAAGGTHTCALTSGGGVVCWGLNTYGQLGNGDNLNSSTPVTVSGLASGVTAIAAGNSHTCALTSAGAVMCWGWNIYGQLGNNATDPSSVPVAVSGLGASIAIATGGTHTCAVAKGGGAVSCWGNDQAGQLGNNQCIDSEVPVAVQGITAGVTGLAGGTAHTCALLTGGALQCWGWNVSGQLGSGTGADSQTAIPVCGF